MKGGNDPEPGDPGQLGALADPHVLDLIERLTPFLRAQAGFRLGPLRSQYDPEDVVQDAWVRALPHLAGFAARTAAMRPVALRFLAVTLRNRVRDLHEKHRLGTRETGSGLSSFSAHERGVVACATRREYADHLDAALRGLADDDRAVVVMRGIEQRAHREVASELAIDEATAKQRYRHALGQLRAALPDGFGLDLAD